MESDADLAAWCDECARVYSFPVEIVRRVLAGLKGSPDAAQILLEACAEYGLDPLATLDEALRTPGAFRITRPTPIAGTAKPGPNLEPPPRKGIPSPSTAQEKLDLGIPARATGMALEICLALLGRAAR